jgi:hypothetical protein
MPTTFNVRALTSTVRVELDDTVTLAEQETIAAQWADLAVEAVDDPTHTIRAGVGSPTEESAWSTTVAPSAEVLADQITSEVTFAGINRLRGKALMLHAAAISTDDGRVIGFVGPSGRGKTTASRALGTAFGYVTDETLAIQPDGVVVPYAKPLSLGERPGNKRTEAASALGLKPTAADDLRLAALVLLDRRPGIEQPYVEPVPVTDVVAELVPQSSFLTELEHPLRTLAELVVSTGGVRRVVYSEAESLPMLIDEILSHTGEDGQTMLTDVDTTERDCDCFNDLLQAQRDGVEKQRIDGPPGTYRRAGHMDALLVDDQLLVLTPGSVTVLEGVGPVVWLAASDSTEDELRAAVLRQLPEPPEGVNPAVVVATAIHELVDRGLLVQN